MGEPLKQHPDRLFSTDDSCRSVARQLYNEMLYYLLLVVIACFPTLNAG